MNLRERAGVGVATPLACRAISGHARRGRCRWASPAPKALGLACSIGAMLASLACSQSDPVVPSGVPPTAPTQSVPPEPASEALTPTAANPTPEPVVVAEPDVPVSGPAFVGPPALRNPVALPDLELGRQVLTLLGGDGAGVAGRCTACHSITRPTLSLWSYRTRAFSSACLGRTTLDSTDQVDETYRCLLEHATKKFGFDEEPSKKYLAPSSLGIYAAASHLPWFSFLMDNASDRQEGARERFVETVGMPRAGERLTQAEFDLVAEWFERDLPGMLDLVPEDRGEPCVPGFAPELVSELGDLAQTGWRARNLETPLLMLGCAPGQTGAECLSGFPNAADSLSGPRWADSVPGSTIRLLYDNSYNGSVYWSRSSADGRYIASGGSGDQQLGGQFVDLQSGRRMLGDFLFDPTFFPDNSSFLVQGSGEEGATLLCNQSVLDGRFETITSERAGCTRTGESIGLYQQLATSLDGGDYWAVNGLFEGDEPFSGPQLRNPYAPFAADTTLSFTPVLNLGNAFERGQTIDVPAPFQGDPALSPSGKLLVTRTKGAEFFSNEAGFGPFVSAIQSGYTFYRVNTTRTGDAWDVSLQRAGQLCLEGGKATFSYDERWLVLYRYITAASAVELGFENAQDPGFAPYAKRGGANIYLVDLRSGQTTRITNMGPGQYALFPHFRSDGWIYFVERHGGSEIFAASDAALRLEEAEARGQNE